MGFLKDAWDSATGKRGRDQQKKDLEAGHTEALKQTRKGFGGAKKILKRRGAEARQQFSSGTQRQREEVGAGYDKAIAAHGSGYDAADARYETPDAIAGREEIARRARGEGGYSDAETEKMKANTREAYGVAARDLNRSISTYAGDATSPGRARESFGRGFSEIARRRAEGERDVDIQSAGLREQQQSDAIIQQNQMAGVRASLDIKRSEGLGRLTVAQAQEMGELTGQEKQFLSSLSIQLGRDLSNLTLDQAQTLADLALGRAAQKAGSRDTTNYALQAAKAGLTAGATYFGGPAAGNATAKGLEGVGREGS